jgi:hypothetical protein
MTNGKNEESIDEAYSNYKKTVGTFDTLVTLRDYLNYIINSDLEIASNGVVSDRTNDIQSTYKIVTSENGVDTKVPIVMTKPDEVTPQLNAFELKTYLLEYQSFPTYDSTASNTSKIATYTEAYNNSFKLYYIPY